MPHESAIDYDLQRLQIEHDQPRWPQFPPAHIFRLARDNSTVGHFVECWRNGLIGWEEMLIGLTCELARQNEEFLKTAQKIELMRTTQIIFEKAPA